MISGTHFIMYSRKAGADRDFFRDVLKLSHVDAGRGWLIFGLPSSELGVHPSAANGPHELYLTCDDINAFVVQMKKKKIRCSTIQNQGWGMITYLTLPGGGKLGVYEPRHPRPKPVKSKARTAKKKS